MSGYARRTLGTLSRAYLALNSRLSAKVASAIIGVAASVLLVAGGASLWVFARAQTETVSALHQLQATTAAQRIARFVDDIDSQLRWLITPSWSSTNDEDRRVDALRTLRASAAVSTLRLLDPMGREQLRVSRLGPDVSGSGTDFGATEAHAIARRQGRHVGPIYFHDGSEPYVTIHVSGKSVQQGSVVADVNLKLISDMIASMRIGEAGRAFLVDAEGRLISHPDISLVLRRTDVSSLPQVRVAREGTSPPGKEVLVAGRDLAGRDILSAHAPVPSLGWYVITELPRAEVLRPIYTSARFSIFALLGGLAASILCGALIARRMIRPIETLTSGASKIGTGVLDHRIMLPGSDELAQLGQRFNEMAESLQGERASLEEKVKLRTHELARANLAKSRFLATASHDLRQPLHALGLFVDELRSDPNEERRTRLNENLAGAISSLNGMFDAILDTSKIEAGAINPSLTRFPIRPLLDAIHFTFEPSAAAKGLRLDVSGGDEWVESDQLLLQRILQNLVSNAVRYTQTGRICVSCYRIEDSLSIAVSDTGPGIPIAIQSEIFGEFFRAPTHSHGHERGLGLGLFIVDSFAQLLNHPVSLNSTPGKGSTFEIRVPIATATSSRQPKVDVQRHVLIGQGLSAAVIDDDPMALAATVDILRSWGFAVEGVAAPSEISEKPFDLLIADYDLGPAGDGLTAVATLRTALPDLCAIIITGKPESVPEAGERCNIEVLQKPTPPLVLRAAIAKALKDRIGRVRSLN